MAGSLALLLAVAGCAASAAGSPRTATSARPAPVSTREPAEAAGGACQLLNYEQVTAAIEVDFDVAGASTSGDTYTCVLRRVDGALPDLSLAVSPTLADTTVFSTSVTPKGAVVVGDLGKLGYSRPLPAASGTGPGAEIGWLSGNQRLMILRYRTPPGTAPTDATALIPKLIALAKKVDQASA
ncbi:MAG: hypothetical protein AUI14_01210 [Actinobacteria bacterium 13_2_20CM_2_71_6]|nr:MAG: hypothetical protein AUI14_01210 [Actinobacteria bacterium 13_2_20CM_2_71_6]